MILKKLLPLVLVALLFGCTSGDDEPTASEPAEQEEAVAEGGDPGPAPGVTDDTIKIGVTYVDTEALAAQGVEIQTGDFEAAYQTLIDQINEDGGIHGRMLEPVFAPVNPANQASQDAACVKLTEDDDVFLVTGFLLGDSALCVLETHETAVIGPGEMTRDRLERAAAPWFGLEGDDLEADVVNAFVEAGELSGKVAVTAVATDSARLDRVVSVLEEAGIEPVETGLVDAPPEDVPAMTAAVRTLGQRFEAAGADTVLLVGQVGLNWATHMEGQEYAPKLLFTELQPAQALLADAEDHDFGHFEGAVTGGLYGPEQAQWEEPKMAACIETLQEAGVELEAPEVALPQKRQTFIAGFFACQHMAMIRTMLEAAGPELGYDSLERAVDDLEVEIPGIPDPATYGPAPSSDGDLPTYLYRFDPEAEAFVVEE